VRCAQASDVRERLLGFRGLLVELMIVAHAAVSLDLARAASSRPCSSRRGLRTGERVAW
jgi:hypothetical protein